MDPEERGRAFLTFIGANSERLRHILTKNVDYDHELIDEVFSYTILRVYDSIVSGRAEVNDYEQYFFMASRNNYIKQRSRLRKRSQREVCLDDMKEEDPIPQHTERKREIPSIEDLKEEVEKLVGKSNSDLFFSYMQKKTEGRISYKTFSKAKGIPAYNLSRMCIKVKKYLMEKYHGIY